MSKRPTVDLVALTSEAATPMAEASQRTARVVPIAAPQAPPTAPAKPTPDRTPTADLQGLTFKVPPAFRKRFRQRAANADIKLNELLFEALDAWEEKRGLQR